MATTDQLTALAADGSFRQRVRNLVLLEAAVVAGEVNTTPNHAARTAFAFKVLGSPGLADQIADVICARTNVTGSTVTFDFSKRGVVTDASDAAIRSQIATDWNMLSGVAS
jgi:hypothetical protein